MFFKFRKCSGWFVFISGFPLLLFFVFDNISYKIFFSFFIFLYLYTNSQLFAFVHHLLRGFVSYLHSKKLWSITVLLHSTILKNILKKKLLDHILYLFSHLLLCCLYLLLKVMLICCGPRMDLMFILNYLIFLIFFKFMLKQIMLMMLQMLDLLICK